MYLKKLSQTLLCAGLLSVSVPLFAETASSAGENVAPEAALAEPKPTTLDVIPSDFSKPGSWVKIQMSGSDDDLLILGSLSNMLQGMLDNSKPRQRNLRIRLGSNVGEKPNLLGLSIEDMDMPEEDRLTKLFFYNPNDKESFQKGIQEYMESHLGLGFSAMPEVPELEKLIAQQKTNHNIDVVVENDTANDIESELPDVPPTQVKASTVPTDVIPQQKN